MKQAWVSIVRSAPTFRAIGKECPVRLPWGASRLLWVVSCTVDRVPEFGLTGGIGSGKSSVSQRLVERGAGLVDADATVKGLQRSGMPVFDAMVAHFGDGIVGADGELDRPAIAAIVFTDEAQLKALNEIVHPAVRDSMKQQREQLAQTHQVVVLDIPLLVEGTTPHGDLAGIIVVDLPVDLAVERLVEHRGFAAEDARARMANQASREDRLAKADFVIDNSGGLADLDAQVDACWAWMNERVAEIGDRDADAIGARDQKQGE